MSCGRGRSPIDRCIGWHGLSEEDYLKKKKEYEDKSKEIKTHKRAVINSQFLLPIVIPLGLANKKDGSA